MFKLAQYLPLVVKPYQQQVKKQGPDTYYCLDYLLPKGDKLRVIASPGKKNTRLILFTYQAELIKNLPGPRPSSLVAEIINKVNHYRLLSHSYTQPLSPPQKEKLKLANHVICALKNLLNYERALSSKNYEQQEKLRQQVLAIIENASNDNHLIADNPVTSEGQLGIILTNAYKTAQNYFFNLNYPTSYEDQFDFGQKHPNTYIVWDSEFHLGYNKEALHNTLRVLSDYYQLTPIKQLNNLPANRFLKLWHFLQNMWQEGRQLISRRAPIDQPSITFLDSDYTLCGMMQKGYKTLHQLVACMVENPASPLSATTEEEASQLLASLANKHWVLIANKNKLAIKVNNQLHFLAYFIQNDEYFPCPAGQDLYDLNQLCHLHRPWTERVQANLKQFVLTIPNWFNSMYQNLIHFIIDELYQDFLSHIHSGHRITSSRNDFLIEDALIKAGILRQEQSILAFIKEHLLNSQYIVAQATHQPNPILYNNPFHRLISVVRHVAGFFIETTERNPSIGLLAMAAYIYGAGAILAPSKLASLLTKLHLKGLIAGIEPTQKLAHFMSHGKASEAISASATFWQGTIAGGHLDKFFINAIEALKNDPAEIAILACLALSMGYGITKIVPNLQNEMGEFPYTTYAALGGKSGAALYDIIMHPGDDWLLGTCKWFSKNTLTALKITFAPFVEAYHYGYRNGFINGWKKSYRLLKNKLQEALAASIDLLLTVITIPLIEGSALLIHVPFRGFTNILRTFLSYMTYVSGLSTLSSPLATLCKTLNYGLTSSCNWLEIQVSRMRQNIVSGIHIKRLQLYHWAFDSDKSQEHSAAEQENQHLDSTKTSCHARGLSLLNEGLSRYVANEKIENMPHYSPLFSSAKNKKDKENEVNLIFHAKF